MKAAPRYSSVTAFLAHWRMLRGAGRGAAASGAPQQAALFAAMEAALGGLKPAERSLLLETGAGATAGLGPAAAPAPASQRIDPAQRRRQQRALIKLGRLLAAAGWLAD